MTQDISSMLAEKEPCMWGRATLVMLVSRTCITVTIITEKVMAHLRPVPIGASGTAMAHVSVRLAAWLRILDQTIGPIALEYTTRTSRKERVHGSMELRSPARPPAHDRGTRARRADRRAEPGAERCAHAAAGAGEGQAGDDQRPRALPAVAAAGVRGQVQRADRDGHVPALRRCANGAGLRRPRHHRLRAAGHLA